MTAAAAPSALTTRLSALDVMKGLLVIFMTHAHVDLCIVNQALSLGSEGGKFVGNVAAGTCYLGFMLAYGYVCDKFYFQNAKHRSTGEQLGRLARSAALPVGGALVTSFAWAWMCFKFPVNSAVAWRLATFQDLVGNGPDFLLGFPVNMFVMFCLRGLVDRGFSLPQAVEKRAVDPPAVAATQVATRGAFSAPISPVATRPPKLSAAPIARLSSRWQCWLTVFLLLASPLALTAFPLADCAGPRKQLQILFPCVQRDAWNANLPALPHLLYFNVGLVWSRLTSAADRGRTPASCPSSGALAAHAGLALGLLLMALPLLSEWKRSAFGAIDAQTRWGRVARGFTGGPSPLYLLGNLFGVYLCCALSWALVLGAQTGKVTRERWGLRWRIVADATVAGTECEARALLGVVEEGRVSGLSSPAQSGPQPPAQLKNAGDLARLAGEVGPSRAISLFATTASPALLEPLAGALAHLGANVLLYLVVADVCLAGLYRGAAAPTDVFPLTVFGGTLVTGGILCVTRFLHYLVASGR